jgi:non-heme chloroperoxidase
MLKTTANPGGLPLEVFDGFRAALAANRAQFFLAVPSGNRPGANGNWWCRCMMGGAKAHYNCIKAFSGIDFTEDLKAVDLPVLNMHGEDDQIVPIADSALFANSREVKQATASSGKHHATVSRPMTGATLRRPSGKPRPIIE